MGNLSSYNHSFTTMSETWTLRLQQTIILSDSPNLAKFNIDVFTSLNLQIDASWVVLLDFCLFVEKKIEVLLLNYPQKNDFISLWK